MPTPKLHKDAHCLLGGVAPPQMGNLCPGAQFLSRQRAVGGAVLDTAEVVSGGTPEALLLACSWAEKEQVNAPKLSLSEPATLTPLHSAEAKVRKSTLGLASCPSHVPCSSLGLGSLRS